MEVKGSEIYIKGLRRGFGEVYRGLVTQEWEET